MSDFQTLLKAHAELVEESLEKLLDDSPLTMERSRPTRLMDALRYSSLDGGKRLRPFLVIASASIFSVPASQAVWAGSALECIHCYSLVHDDLPAMDDDDLRRGRPTTHKAFDEATAILVGDALLTLAFDILSRNEVHKEAEVRIELVQLFSRFAGLGGMVGGQMLDLEAETKPALEEADIMTLQAMKTGALIRCACETGAVLGGASAEQRMALVNFGQKIGQAFQLADDILDVTSDAQTMGKQTSKDADRGKGTLVSLYGLEKSRVLAGELLDEAVSYLEAFGNEADILRDAARFVVERKN